MGSDGPQRVDEHDHLSTWNGKIEFTVSDNDSLP